MSNNVTSPGRPPRAVTVVRVLLLLTGTMTAVNGLLEQNPDYARSTHVLGCLLIALGAACWRLVLRLRAPGRGTRELVAVLALLGSARVYQAVGLHSPTALTGLIGPALVLWRVSRPDARAWVQPGARAAYPGAGRRAFALLGAVGLTASTLVLLGAAGATAALWPCALPQPKAGALDTTGTTDGGHTAPTGSVTATDGTQLAYYAYEPAHPIAALVFYHGSGADSAAGYLPLGDLASRYRIATYLVDIRGHGASGGPRGDAPSREQVWRDVATMTDFAHRRHPDVPEFLGGHSAGAGLVLNSLGTVTTPVAGYVLLAPDLGLHSDTAAVGGAGNFATVCRRPFIVNALSNHALDGHTRALGFAYPQSEVDSAGLVPRYTVTMAIAQNPDRADTDLKGIRQPLGVWIGSRDEVFTPDKVLDYVRRNRPPTAPTALTAVPGANHLGLLNSAADAVGPWITALAQH
ncbi:alpha/beta fold hydrolase [Kitasatospora sp. NPDC048722]|uniref:alpha/beta hydrolase n=1 Tax=Kitasatospora sp. NPDC048722 TaxID=3155639 RepID=UPI003402624A